MDQYAIAKFFESFEMVPKTLAENIGLNAMEIISSLYAEHASGKTKVGIDLEKGVCTDISTMNVWDLYVTKFFVLKYTADAACTVLRVNQVNFELGIQILKIFKSHSSKRCVLDDFGFYEARERIMQQKRAKQHQLQKQARHAPFYYLDPNLFGIRWKAQ